MSLRDFWQRILGTPAEPGSASEHSDAGPAAGGVDPEQRALLEAKLGYTFRDPTLLDNALLHRSHSLVVKNSREDSNERLEFLGDAVLGLVVNDYLFHRYDEASEGDLTKMKSQLVCGSRLSEVAKRLDLGAHILMSRSEAATGGRRRASILSDATEAIIGAIYLDGGLAAAQRTIQRCLLAGSDESLKEPGLDNHKSRLQELIQARHKNPPRYRVVKVDGPDHARVFQVMVTFNGHELGRGDGPNKKTAEQVAAEQALAKLAENDDLLDELADRPE